MKLISIVSTPDVPSPEPHSACYGQAGRNCPVSSLTERCVSGGYGQRSGLSRAVQPRQVATLEVRFAPVVPSWGAPGCGAETATRKAIARVEEGTGWLLAVGEGVFLCSVCAAVGYFSVSEGPSESEVVPGLVELEVAVPRSAPAVRWS